MQRLLLISFTVISFLGCEENHRTSLSTAKNFSPPGNPWYLENTDSDSDQDGLTDFQEIWVKLLSGQAWV